MDSIFFYIDFFMKGLRVAIAINVILRHGIEDDKVLTAALNTSSKPRKNKCELIPLLHFMYELINREVAGHGGQQPLDCCLIIINIEKITDHQGSPNEVHSLNIDFDKDETILMYWGSKP